MYKCFFKRLFDFIISLIAILILSPFYIILTILGFIFIKGNPFFVQERPGKDEKIFKLIKYKSMTDEKDENGNLLPDEKRYTHYGMFLRKTSLDELPELFNILKGDMAIIGPRPLLVSYLDLYTKEEHNRHSVRPGLTGLAQVNGRNYLTWEEVFSYDLEYVKNISFINDVKIIIKTIKEVLSSDVEDRSQTVTINGDVYIKEGESLRLVHAPLDVERRNNKEIGSDFYSMYLSSTGNNYFDNVNWFVSGRAALDFVLRDIKAKHKDVRTIAIPSWCCDTMLEPIIRNNLEYIFYPVTIKDNKLNKDINVKADILLNLNYFGFEENKEIKFDGIMINDVTHSIFTLKDETSDYIFGSLRKWSSFVTGGFAYSKDGFVIEAPKKTNEEYINLKLKAISTKKSYIKGKIDTKDYLELFKNAEKMLDSLYEFNAYKEDIEDAKYLDVELLRRRRIRNVRFLIKRLNNYSIFKEAKENDCPLFVPIIVPNKKRDELRNYLIKNNIYCPVHWPLTDLHKLTEEEKFIYDNELSLVCDQRYNINDMDKICNLIEEFLNA